MLAVNSPDVIPERRNSGLQVTNLKNKMSKKKTLTVDENKSSMLTSFKNFMDLKNRKM